MGRRLCWRGHFIQPASSAELIEMMEDTASPLRRFIKECCEAGPGCSGDYNALYRRYRGWCLANEHRVMSKTKFKPALIAAEPAINIRRLGLASEKWRVPDEL